MKPTGYLLITLGFLAGAYFAVQQAEDVAVGAFLGSLAAGAVGIALVRTATRAAQRDEQTLESNVEILLSSLQRVAGRIGELDQTKQTIDVYELRHHIDRDFPTDLDAFVQARESLIHRFGLTSYADVMNHFAAGERYLNRVWSTSTDGYVDEAHRFLSKAREQFETALAKIRSLTG